MSNDVWQKIEQARERWNVLEHPFYQRWSAGELTREELADYSGQYRHATAAIARLSADVAETRARLRARRPAPARRGGGGPHRPLGRFRRGRRRRSRRRAEPRDQGVRRRLDRVGRPHLPARPPLRDRERPAGDLEDEARGPRRPLRDRRRSRQRVLPRPRAGRRRPRRRGPLADRSASRRRRSRRPGRGRRVRLRGELAPARRGHRGLGGTCAATSPAKAGARKRRRAGQPYRGRCRGPSRSPPMPTRWSLPTRHRDGTVAGAVSTGWSGSPSASSSASRWSSSSSSSAAKKRSTPPASTGPRRATKQAPPFTAPTGER